MAEETIAQIAKPLTQFEMGLLFIIALLILTTAGVILFWIIRTNPQQKPKLDPIYKGTYLSILLYIAFVITPAVFGFIEPETAKKATIWFVGVTLILVAFYGFIVPFFLNKPIPTEKLWEQYVLPEVRHLFGGENYQGDAYRPPFVFSRVIPSAYSTYLQESGIKATLVEIFLTQHVYGNKLTGNTFQVLSIRDKITGEGLERHMNPPLSIVNELLGREVARSYKQPLEEYDTETPQIKRVQ